MRRFLLFVFTVILLASLSACGGKTSDEQASINKGETAAASASPQIVPGGKESASPTAGPAPKVFSPEELLSAADATGLVGQAVTATFDSAGVSETGETSGTYVYDLPHEGVDVKDTIIASLCITQNGLISPSELQQGHDANWAFEEFKKYVPDKVVELTGLGGKAFYVKDNSDVHVLFQDYYILVAFIKDDTDLEATLALNKSIAAFIINKISLDDSSLT